MNMAENPNDKALREKLLSAEYAYDPGAWAAMEQLMERKKKRGLLWWWLSSGAVAVALLVSAGVYHYNFHVAPRFNVASSAAVAAASKHQTTSPGAAGHMAIGGTTAQQPLTAAKQTASSADHTATTSLPSEATGFVPFTPGTSARRRAHATQTKSVNTLADTEHSISESKQTSGQLFAADLPAGSSIDLDHSSLEKALDNSGESTPAIPAYHKRKVMISYALGAETGFYASYARKTFCDQPTWSMGISQQLHIGKYFAITNSILYSEVHFKINNPVYPDNNYNDLRSYQSKIKELSIPIGIKVYLYTSRRLRLSAGVSYINHIKVNETFSYQLTPKVPPSSMIPIATADFPGTNNFQPSAIADAQYTAGNQVTNGALMEYYSLGNGKRYYGSMLYTVGVDILLPHRISISAEPAMRMSIGKIKVQNSRVYDFGMNAGVKYTF